MSRQQLPPQIKKVDVTDRKTGKRVVRYELTADAGKSSDGRRRQVRRRYASEREARQALAKVTGGSPMAHSSPADLRPRAERQH
jgi:hypothetical protein